MYVGSCGKLSCIQTTLALAHLPLEQLAFADIVAMLPVTAGGKMNAVSRLPPTEYPPNALCEIEAGGAPTGAVAVAATVDEPAGVALNVTAPVLMTSYAEASPNATALNAGDPVGVAAA